MKVNNRKKKIFDLFSQNLRWFLEEPQIAFRDSDTGEEVEDGYVCPICFNAFGESDLLSAAENPLTLEDVPPKSSGGTIKTLTCKSCNSKAGHDLDAHLVNRLKQLDLEGFLPNASADVTFQIEDYKVNGRFDVDDKGAVIIDIDTDRSDPKQSDEFSKRVNPKGKTSLSFTPKKLKSDERKAEIALLRIAYLEAFSAFGYGFMLNGGLVKVREQLMNPDKNLMSKVLWIKFKFNKEQYGMNIIREPKELRCFLVIFDIVTKSKTYQTAIALPGPSYLGINIYDNIEKLLCQGDSGNVKVTIEHISTDDCLKEKEYTFYPYLMWQEFCQD